MTELSRVELWLWAFVLCLVCVWSALLPDSMSLFGVAVLIAYAIYDVCQYPKTRAKLSANRFFSLLVIGFLMSLSWLDFATALTGLVVFTGGLWIAYRWSYREVPVSENPYQLAAWADVAKNYAPLLLLVWAVRSFIIQPYHVPTGSLEPSILPHELILVKQYAYGLRLPAWPITNAKMVGSHLPQRGDIALFRSPQNEKILLIKRVIGLPGDHIRYDNQQLYINGKLSEQVPVNATIAHMIDSEPHDVPQNMAIEKLVGGKDHYILVSQGEHRDGVQSEWVVPEHQYFMMGDNRDNSYDSRFWGFVPEQNFIGKAWFVFLSWDQNHHFRWDRFGTSL